MIIYDALWKKFDLAHAIDESILEAEEQGLMNGIGGVITLPEFHKEDLGIVQMYCNGLGYDCTYQPRKKFLVFGETSHEFYVLKFP